MKNKKIIIGSVVIVTLFVFISLANKYTLIENKYSIIEDIENIMINQQQLLYVNRTTLDDDLSSLRKSIEEESMKKIKDIYKISLKNVASKKIKEDGKTYIILEATIKDKFLTTDIEVKSEPQLFYKGDDIKMTEE